MLNGKSDSLRPYLHWLGDHTGFLEALIFQLWCQRSISLACVDHKSLRTNLRRLAVWAHKVACGISAFPHPWNAHLSKSSGLFCVSGRNQEGRSCFHWCQSPAYLPLAQQWGFRNSPLLSYQLWGTHRVWDGAFSEAGELLRSCRASTRHSVGRLRLRTEG